MPDLTFFEHDVFVVVPTDAAGHAFRVHDAAGAIIGDLDQPASTQRRIFGIVYGGGEQTLRMFVHDTGTDTVASVERQPDKRRAHMIVGDATGHQIGGFEQTGDVRRPVFTVVAADGGTIATIAGTWAPLAFTIADARGQVIGTVATGRIGLDEHAVTGPERTCVVTAAFLAVVLSHQLGPLF
jgi:hypothetical protein